MWLVSVVACALLQASDPQRGTSGVLPQFEPIAYTLGTGDAITVRVSHVDEIGAAPYLVDVAGEIVLPMVGRVPVAGRTVREVETSLRERFALYVREPMVVVTVAEYGSRPVSVLGSVGTPGVRSIKGETHLIALLAEAGGLRDEAGNTVRIARRVDQGPLPLPGAALDEEGSHYVAQVNVRSLMDARRPAENIAMRPHDVVSVPRADLIYVIGAVKKPGGFPLHERERLTVLEALALAEGLERTASPRSAKILRLAPGAEQRAEVPVDLRNTLAGKQLDAALQPNDILFVPNSAAKSATLRSIEAAIQLATGIVIWRR